MTEQQHPITPPPELQEEWLGLWPQDALLQAARWGADQELEACCKWLDEVGPAAIPLWGKDLRIDRRSKPKSLAEPALEALDDEQAEVAISSYKVIRRALERLQDLEGQGDD